MAVLEVVSVQVVEHLDDGKGIQGVLVPLLDVLSQELGTLARLVLQSWIHFLADVILELLLVNAEQFSS